MFRGICLRAGQYAFTGKYIAQKFHRVPLQRQSRHLVIGGDMLADGHDGQRDFCLLRQFPCVSGCKQGQFIRRCAPCFPTRLTPVKTKRAQGVRIRQQV